MAQPGFTNIQNPIRNDFGFDIGYDIANNDMFTSDSLVGGNTVVAQRLARMLFTPKGALAAIDPDPKALNWGWDCRSYMNAALNPAQISAAQGQITGALLQDECVLSANVNFNLQQNSGNLAIACNITTASGPFQLVLSINNVSSSVVYNTGFNGNG